MVRKYYQTKIGMVKKLFERKFSKSATIPSPIQTILSALDLHQILHTQRWLAGLELPHHRRLGISPDPEGNYLISHAIVTYLLKKKS